MDTEFRLPLQLTSDGERSLRITVERVGRDLLCHVHGGDDHVGSVALAEWRGGRARTRCLNAAGHREEAIARHAAHTLCSAARCSVACVAGIHFDGISPEEIEAVSAEAYSMARRAAEALRDDRLRRELRAAEGTWSRIAARRADCRERWRGLFGVPLSAALEKHRDEIAVAREVFAGEVGLFAPLYLSNACTNDCVYCGFRRSSAFGRDRLSIEEAVHEADALAGTGIRAIDLVTGEIPADPFVEYVCEASAAILSRTGIRRVHLNLGSLSSDQYRRLRAAGATGYHLYQETYDPDAYLNAHRAGGKREMTARLEAPHRAAEAGFEYVGMGVLLGLADLETDVTSLAAHAAILRDDHPGLRIGFSLPRIRATEADPGYQPARPVSDADFMRAMLFMRLTHPRAHLTLTTREAPELRDRMLELGVTRLSAGVSTAPGGYGSATATARPEAREQFDVSDSRSVDEIAALVSSVGLTPVFD